MDGRVSRQHRLWRLWVPTGVLFLAAVLGLQETFGTRRECRSCGGTGWIGDCYTEGPPPPLFPCDACGPRTTARLGRWARMAARQLPTTPLGAWAWSSTLFAVALAASLRLVHCRRCGDAEGPGEASCAACGGRGRLTLLDRWLDG